MVQTLWKTVWRFLKKLKIQLLYDPAILLQGIHQGKTVIQKDACATVFTAPLFTITRTGKQSKCPLTAEWIKKLWYRYIMEYYAAISTVHLSPVLQSCLTLSTPWTASGQASLSMTSSWSLLTLISIHELVMPSNHLILCRPLLLLPSIFPSSRVFYYESALCIKWLKYWGFNFSINTS